MKKKELIKLIGKKHFYENKEGLPDKEGESVWKDLGLRICETCKGNKFTKLPAPPHYHACTGCGGAGVVRVKQHITKTQDSGWVGFLFWGKWFPNKYFEFEYTYQDDDRVREFEQGMKKVIEFGKLSIQS